MTDTPQIDNMTARQAAVPEAAARRVEAKRAVTSPTEVARVAKAREYRSAVDRSADPSDAQSLVDALSTTRIPDQARSTAIIEGKIGTTFDTTTGVKAPIPAEQARIDAANSADVILRGIIESGALPADLTPLIASMEPLIDSIYTDPPLTAAQRAQFVKDIVKDPGVREKLRARYPQILGEAMPDVLAAQRAAIEANTRLAAAGREVTDIDGKLTAAKTEQGDPATAGRLRTLEGYNLDVRLTAVQRELNGKYAELDRATTPRDKEFIQREIDGREVGLRELQDQVAERNGLRNLPQEIERLSIELEASKGRQEIASGEKNAADEALSQAKGARVDAENRLVENLQNGLRDAAIAQIDENMERIRAEGVQQLQEDARTAETDLDRRMALGVANRYLKLENVTIRGQRGGVRQRFRRGPDQTYQDIGVDSIKAHDDMENLIRFGGEGTAAIVRSQLEEIYKDPLTGVVDQASVDKAMNDPAFVEKWGKQLGKSAIEVFAQTGGVITPNQARYMEAQPWGKALIDQALTSSEVAKAEQLLSEQNKLPPGGLKEFVKTREGKALLAIILGLAAGAVMPAMLASSMAVQSVQGSH